MLRIARHSPIFCTRSASIPAQETPMGRYGPKPEIVRGSGSIVVNPIPVGTPWMWSRLQHLYWSALHRIDQQLYFGPTKKSHPFDYMLSVKEEILRNRDAGPELTKQLLDDFEKHVIARDWLPRQPNFLASGGQGYQTDSVLRYPANRVGVYPHGTPFPFPKIDHNDDGPVELL
eukprot:TRINITY_DN5690_c0_g1_i1.p2 TRINITY_DN5690_c0_g1~~TRINITY_DN5690_c0_g1_i1.p2  ORF type:complete len:174 (+),score=28.76 TRINITY_DN5690_c0_g1_i1:57-578(+)